MVTTENKALRDQLEAVTAALAEAEGRANAWRERAETAERELASKTALAKALRIEVANLKSAARGGGHGGGASGADDVSEGDFGDAAADGKAAGGRNTRRRSSSVSIEAAEERARAMARLMDLAAAIPYAEDSPMFQAEVRQLDALAQELQGFCKGVVKATRKYIDGGHAFLSLSSALADSLAACRDQAWCLDKVELSGSLTRFSRTLTDIAEYEQVLMMSLEGTFATPMEDFVLHDVEETRRLCAVAREKQSACEAAVSKYLHTKSSTPGGETRLEDAASAARAYELARFDMCRALNVLEARKSVHLIERVCSALYAMRAFYHQAHDICEELSPSMLALQMALQKSQTVIAQRDDELGDIRAQLQKRLDAATGSTVLDDILEAARGISLIVAPHETVPGAHGPPDGAAVEHGAEPPRVVSPPSAAAATEAAVRAGQVASGAVPRSATPPAAPVSADAAASLSRTRSRSRSHSLTEAEIGEVRQHLDGGGATATAAAGDGVADRATESSSDSDEEEVVLDGPSAPVVSPPGRRRSLPQLPSQSLGLEVDPGVVNAGGTGASAAGGAGGVDRVASGRSASAAVATNGPHSPGSSSLRAPARAQLPSSGDDARVIKAGYLYKRSSGKHLRKDWKKRWFFVRDGALWYIRGAGNLAPEHVSDLMLCNVRESFDPDSRFCFEVRSPGSRVYMLQASSEASCHAWVKTLRTVSETLLTSGSGGNSTGAGGGEHGGDSAGAVAYDTRLRSLQLANPTCAECGAQQPDWASLNLGVLVCIACSGIHRGLGVHVSKVRSLTLDAWTDDMCAIVAAVGNDRANAVYEAAVPEGWVKPHPDASREERRKWIEAKYVYRGFVDAAAGSTPEGLSLELCNAAADGNIAAAARALSLGADIDWHDPARQQRTSLHLAAAAGHKLMIEFLLLNSAALDASDAMGTSAHGAALEAAQEQCASLLTLTKDTSVA